MPPAGFEPATPALASIFREGWTFAKDRGYELFTSAAVALPLIAYASCPVGVLPEPEHLTQQPPYFVVGVDGIPHSAAAVDFAFEEAAPRAAVVRVLYVGHAPLLGVLDEGAAIQEYRRLLSETVAGRTAGQRETAARSRYRCGGRQTRCHRSTHRGTARRHEGVVCAVGGRIRTGHRLPGRGY
ncbi:universal stress protein [Streptomyces hirsutus]|uniref:universal stress protein n=1 Tax=Streptomyces hirsutus TaxID=35620 RepID=UPI00362577D1